MDTTTISKPRECLECGRVFDAATATKPAGVCSGRCKKIRHAARVRDYRKRKREEFEHLQAIVNRIEDAIAA